MSKFPVKSFPMLPNVYYVWVGGSCDYGHEERASAGVKLVPYHKYPELLKTHDLAHEAMKKLQHA